MDDQNNQSQDNQAWGHPGAPIDDQAAAITAVPPIPDEPVAEDGSIPTPAFTPHPDPGPPPAQPPTPAPQPQLDNNANGLLDIKQQALQQLSPLVGQLDQAPEDKFRTLMMMIQASDDQQLVQAAYEAAGQITDEKARAQALLDIVNEINYFTQSQDVPA